MAIRSRNLTDPSICEHAWSFKGPRLGSSSPDEVTACPHCWSTLIPRHSVVTLSGRFDFSDRSQAFHRSNRESRVPLPLVPSFITYGIIIIIGGTLGCFVFCFVLFLVRAAASPPSEVTFHDPTCSAPRNFVDLFTFGGRARHSEGRGGRGSKRGRMMMLVVPSDRVTSHTVHTTANEYITLDDHPPFFITPPVFRPFLFSQRISRTLCTTFQLLYIQQHTLHSLYTTQPHLDAETFQPQT